MPKRKHNYDYLSEQLKKLKKKIKRVRKQEDSSCSSDENVEMKNDAGTGVSADNNDNLLEEYMAENTNNEETLEIPLPISDLTEITNKDQLMSQTQNKENEDSGLDQEILEILGDDPASKEQYGPEIHKELASRLQHIATSGLSKETKKELQQRYLLPSNGNLLGAPAINAEIRAALPESLANRDKAIEAKQKFLGSAISCIASATTQILSSQNKDHELLKKLMDANRILCDVQHSDSVTRRMFSTSVLKKDVKTQILNSKIDKLLFGENLPDTLKTAKAVSKSSAEIKNSYNINNNKKQPQPSTSKTNHLNMKGPAAPSRKPPVVTQKSRQTAHHQNQHSRSFKTSSHQQKFTNYRRH